MANPILVAQATNLNASSGFLSILGDKSAFYRTKTQEGAGILDVPEEGTLEFYCAGYTKPDPHGISRQEYHKKIYVAAAKASKENEFFPLPMNDYSLSLEHDPNNKFDANLSAIRILFRPLSDNLKKLFLGFPSEIELGFVPARINVSVLANIHMINNIKILKTRVGFHEKYCTTKVVIAYGHNKLGCKFLPSGNRFLGILDEV